MDESGIENNKNENINKQIVYKQNGKSEVCFCSF